MPERRVTNALHVRMALRTATLSKGPAVRTIMSRQKPIGRLPRKCIGRKLRRERSQRATTWKRYLVGARFAYVAPPSSGSSRNPLKSTGDSNDAFDVER